MKIDHDYLKKLLETCEAMPGPVFDIGDLKAAGLDYDNDQFIFHMGILDDDGFIEREDQEPGFGLIRGLDGHLAWAAVPLRLTAKGHQFIKGLRDPKVWAIVKRDFKDASAKTLWIVVEKFLGNILGG